MAVNATGDVETLYRYKYLPFTEGSLKMVTEGTLKYTCPLDFNDPFDCMPAYDPASIDSLHLNRPDLILRVAEHHGVSLEEARIIGVENAHKGVESGDFARELVSTLGVVSLSRNPTNILMWSHYADHHKGFVVELRIAMDAPRQLLEGIMPFPVEYQAERPIIDWGSGCDIAQYFLTKSPDWEYEQEERILTTWQGPGIHPYSRKHFLWAVIAGSRMSPENYLALQTAVDQAAREIGREIPLYRAALAGNKYKVYVPGHPAADSQP
ncbi:DUF2971 domain-containing protein [Pseudomonas putida]|uniref:DUF2971 domain-containing protein n=1 Tax=Pseudomonas putida TaxID=303 RepID=A0A3M8TI10_PSEPU|nr:DUF2971 domain-containing protein [Pseudomonas putida]RNF92998.1 DUF2971 domain-containing protein [Pseudomonas putida]